jgi:hypothetical protein
VRRVSESGKSQSGLPGVDTRAFGESAADSESMSDSASEISASVSVRSMVLG